jgi:hypothetical protein
MGETEGGRPAELPSPAQSSTTDGCYEALQRLSSFFYSSYGLRMRLSERSPSPITASSVCSRWTTRKPGHDSPRPCDALRWRDEEH